MTKIKNVKIISYNLKYHQANSELFQLVSDYDADILAIQECYADQLPEEIGHLTLSDRTHNGKFNLAIYHRKGRFVSTDSSAHVLKLSTIERIYMPLMERLLVSKIYDRDSEQEITLGTFHATHHVATNSLRRKQIKSAHNLLTEQSGGSPAIMVGDYNYYLFKRGLRVCIEETGYRLSLSDRPTYYLNKYLKARFDFATSFNLYVDRVLTLPKSQLSDHAPILVEVII